MYKIFVSGNCIASSDNTSGDISHQCRIAISRNLNTDIGSTITIAVRDYDKKLNSAVGAGVKNKFSLNNPVGIYVKGNIGEYWSVYNTAVKGECKTAMASMIHTDSAEYILRGLGRESSSNKSFGIYSETRYNDKRKLNLELVSEIKKLCLGDRISRWYGNKVNEIMNCKATNIVIEGDFDELYIAGDADALAMPVITGNITGFAELLANSYIAAEGIEGEYRTVLYAKNIKHIKSDLGADDEREAVKEVMKFVAERCKENQKCVNTYTRIMTDLRNTLDSIH